MSDEQEHENPVLGQENEAPRVAEATMVSANTSSLGGGKSMLAKYIEEAMSQAVTDCAKEGITDPDEVRERMLKARAETKQKYNAAVAAAIAQG